MHPSALVKPSDAHSPGHHLGCDFLRDPEPEPASQPAPGLLPLRPWTPTVHPQLAPAWNSFPHGSREGPFGLLPRVSAVWHLLALREHEDERCNPTPPPPQKPVPLLVFQGRDLEKRLFGGFFNRLEEFLSLNLAGACQQPQDEPHCQVSCRENAVQVGERSPGGRTGPAAGGGASPPLSVVLKPVPARRVGLAWTWPGPDLARPRAPGASALALLCFFLVPPPHKPGQALLCKSLFFTY